MSDRPVHGAGDAQGERPKPDPNAEWWTTTDVAAYLGVGVQTVSTYRSRGQMPAPEQRFGRTWLWRPQTVIQWHESRRGPGRWR